MNTRKAILSQSALAVGTLLYGFALYPALPDRIPIHWNWRGEVDGWADKSIAVLLGPGLIALFTALTVALPRLSPRRFEIETFRPTYDWLMLVCAGLFAFIHVVALQTALHPELPSGRILMGGLFLFFALMGNVLGRVRRNFWIGVRTPWTLASDRVWQATHRMAAHSMAFAGVAGALLLLLGAPVALCLALFLAALLWPVVYSYLLYRREG